MEATIGALGLGGWGSGLWVGFRNKQDGGCATRETLIIRAKKADSYELPSTNREQTARGNSAPNKMQKSLQDQQRC